MESIVVALVLFGILYWWYNRVNPGKKAWQVPKEKFPEQWRVILQKEVTFYATLTPEEKQRFEFKVQEFLLNCRITGIKTSVELIDKLYIAASAVIPIFGFDDWKYTNIHEVLLYPSRFNADFEVEGKDRSILGMVGNGFMEGVMILSKEALHHGFKNDTDKRNTAIHEFVHLLDKSDGVIDGIPAALLDRQFAIPWFELINTKIQEILAGQSDINPYGTTNKAEFFAVASEYFFERPQLLAKKHPKLYALLEMIFKQEMASRNLQKSTVTIGRNSPCPCNSGEKFKRCCGAMHFN